MATLQELEARRLQTIKQMADVQAVINNTTNPAQKAALQQGQQGLVKQYQAIQTELDAVKQPAPVVNNTTAPVPVGPTESELAGLRSSPEPVAGPTESELAGLRTSPTPAVVPTIVALSRPSGDWRARLQLAPGSDYLYNAADADNGILGPLKATNGVVFPYTPQVDLMYRAEYAESKLTHSNWKAYHYTGSMVDALQVTGTFTAQDNREAAYLLAVIHFFRSSTKMFYGQDFERGSPPPVLFFSAFGEHQYNNSPVLLKDFNYSILPDVDFIRTVPGVMTGGTTSVISDATRRTNPLTSALSRLERIGLGRGGSKATQAQPTRASTKASYVPSRISITLTLLPIQSRVQMSKEFSLKDYASGKLVTKGFF
jgi:hypothetical protein